MADPNQVKLFKQYLIDTNAFHTLAETLSMLHTADPKPDDAMDFIRKRLSEPIDAEEFHCMKQSLSKLNEDMGQMKADMTKISNIVSKLLPDQSNDCEQSVANVSVLSMENNVGDTSHISMLDDTSLIFDQSVSNESDLNTTMHTDQEPQLNCSDIDAVNLSQSKDALNDSAQAFTMEFVEVDVVNKSSNLTGSQDETMQIDESVVDDMNVTSTPETTMTTATDSAVEKPTDAYLTELNIEQLPIVFKEEDSEEQLSLSQGFRGFDDNDVKQSKSHLPDAKIDEPDSGETLQKDPDTEMVEVKVEVHEEPKTEYVELKTENIDASATETTKVENGKISQNVPTELLTKSEASTEFKALVESKTIAESDLPATDSLDEKRSIVESILDKVVKDVMEVGESDTIDDVIIPVDGPQIETSTIAESIAQNSDGCTAIAMPKDDPETQLFLSYS